MDLNPLKFADFAKQASKKFVEEAIPLNKSIAKIAEENNMSPMQIQRVVEMANSDTNQRLYKTAGDKTFTFDLASLDGVRATINPGTTMAKTAQVMDVMFPSRAEKTAKIAQEIEKVAAAPTKAATDPLIEKRACLAFESLIAEGRKRVARLELDKLAFEMEKDAAFTAMKDMAKDFVVLERGKLSNMYKFACMAHPESRELWQQVFTDMRQDLMKLGHPVDKALIDEKFGDFETPTETINGRHAMLVLLDTFKDKIGKIDRTSGKLALYNDAPDPVPMELISITNNEDVRKVLAEEVEKLASIAANLDDDELLKAAAGPVSKAIGGAGSWAVQNPYASIPLAYLAYRGLRDVGKGVGRAIQDTRRPTYLEQPGHAGYRGF